MAIAQVVVQALTLWVDCVHCFNVRIRNIYIFMNSGREASSLKYPLKQPILSVLLKNYLYFASGCMVLCIESAR